MSKKSFFFIILLILLLAGGVAYYFLYYESTPVQLIETETNDPVTFSPLNRSSTPSNNIATAPTSTPAQDAPQQNILPILRHLSSAPIGGFMASTTGSSAVVRYIDRGVGHVYEVLSAYDGIKKISNTTIPRIYESYWNKNLNAAILRYPKEENGTITTFYGEIKAIKTATSTEGQDSVANEIKGKFLSSSIKELAVSPKGDKIFTLNIESGRGIGYISGFDESKKTKVIDMPFTQVNVDWPAENIVSILTKPSGLSSGYLYLLDTQKSSLKKVLGGIIGLTARASPDATKILFSSGGQNKMTASVFNTKDSSAQEIVFKTIADKCVWSKINKDDVYCAVPTEIPDGIYPDDWYKGKVSFTDQIWYLDVITREVRLIANLVNLSNDLIDAVNLTLDPKENFLYFVNKRDLTLWSLDLNP